MSRRQLERQRVEIMRALEIFDRLGDTPERDRQRRPVLSPRVRFEKERFGRIDIRLRARLTALTRLEAAVRLGRLPTRLYERDGLALRWMRALAAWDMNQAGASQIDIAIALFGAEQIDADTVDRMRKRVARLLDLARRRIAIAYGRLFRGGSGDAARRTRST
jgi:hypothetical protein